VCSRKAVFVDTDQVPATESLVGDLVQNVTEAILVQQFTECLIRGGIHPDQIGVVTLYRQQIKLLSHLLGSQPDVEILTADRSQGRDKDCIIISMVRSNEEGTVRFIVSSFGRCANE
jgi:DNA replication ATP-dependent helicase Dna2